MKLRSSQRCGICQEDCNNAVCPGSCAGHFFCETCLITWARRKSTCPICRAAFDSIVTLHGYTLARQVKASALVSLYIRSEARPEEAPEVLQLHLSWVDHMADAVGVLNRFPRPVAAALLQQLHVNI
jgi:hypothetical protein